MRKELKRGKVGEKKGGERCRPEMGIRVRVRAVGRRRLRREEKSVM